MSRSPLVAHFSRLILHALERSSGPHEFGRENHQTEPDDDQSWSRQDEHRHAYRQHREARNGRNDDLQPPHVISILVPVVT